jgi:glycosyltransferase involved in cell wall biosynthesis
MYKKRKIAVSVPAYNEKKLIRKTLETIPSFIDLIVVVDDKSKDKTSDEIIACKKKDKRIHFIASKKNQGLGKTVIKAHTYASEKSADIVVVMAGDNQMNPKYLPLLLDAIIDDNYDYVKGNRFFHRQDLKTMPKYRILGNIFLTFVSKFCTGYWSISDPINGYTALRITTLKKIDMSKIASRYGFEPSLLIELSLINAKVKDVFIPAKYGTEKSKVNLLLDPFKVLRIFAKGYIRRMVFKYMLYDFHPIALFYGMGFAFIFIGLVFGIFIAFNSVALHRVASPATAILFAVPFLLGVQFILQAIVLDIQNEPQ